MRKFLAWLIGFFIVAGLTAFVVYKFYLPGIVASALVEGESSVYVPKFVQNRIQKYKAPVNEGADDLIRTIHKANIPLEEVLDAVDRTEPEQVRAMIDELNQMEVENTDQVFDVARKYFYTEFDIEILRKPFKENVDMDLVRTGLKKASQHRGDESVDGDMAKAIIKQILVQKEKEYQSTSGIR